MTHKPHRRAEGSVLSCNTPTIPNLRTSRRPDETHYCLPVVRSQSYSVPLAVCLALTLDLSSSGASLGCTIVALRTEYSHAIEADVNLQFFLSSLQRPSRDEVGSVFRANRPGQGERAERIWEISWLWGEDSDMLFVISEYQETPSVST